MVIQRCHQLLQTVTTDRHDSGKAFADIELFRVGVFMLDNRAHGFIRLAHDAAITKRVFGDKAQDTNRGVISRVYYLRQGFGLNKRYVAKQHKYIVTRLDRVETLRQRMSGTKLLSLFDVHQLLTLHGGMHLPGGMAGNHDNLPRVELTAAIDHMLQHWLAGQFMNHLGTSGLHARSLACGENDDSQ